ncbi:DUF501 domain-containing protein [Candidatus Bipolaricaulota bacterium]|nr:DUF501 domain-containing protein [Candidatus Bipolaricaulota bacterium]
MRPPTPEDLRILAIQLGRKPRGVLAVKPCPYGFPQVILNHPLLPQDDEGEPEPMPTIFWLTCPFLVREVSKLESDSAIKRYERMLSRDEGLLQEFRRAHEAYRTERISLLSEEEIAWVKERGWNSLLTTGIAGISDPKRVKCLHAHLAHFLAGRENPIGRRVAEELPCLFCSPERIFCQDFLSASN